MVLDEKYIINESEYCQLLAVSFTSGCILQISHEYIGESGCIYFAYGSAETLQKPLLIKLKNVVQET